MKPILILSYFYPPCNLTASQRAYGWVRFLNEFGYYPIVITRSWDIEINVAKDALRKVGDTVQITKGDGFEVHHLPYRPSLRDRLFINNNGNAIVSLLQKALTVAELVSVGFSSLFISYTNIYTYARKCLKNNSEIQKMIITANPFVMFKFGYLLNKEFGTQWIADYRDDWTTTSLVKSKSRLEQFIFNLDRKNEKKWVSSAAQLTSISTHYSTKITRLVGIKGSVLLNGYLADDFESSQVEYFSNFTLVYNGTLYPSQPIEEVLRTFKKFISHQQDNTIRLKFVGTGFDPKQKQRILKEANELNLLEYIEITDRIPRMEVLNIQQQAHVLLMITHAGMKGVPSSKLYEYLAIGNPIVSFPADNDIVDKTLNDYNLGFVCHAEKELLSVLDTLYTTFKTDTYSELQSDTEYVNQFSRKNQTKILAQLLDTL
jgi:glycosyltransferase involved in cell wall biosynthesis